MIYVFISAWLVLNHMPAILLPCSVQNISTQHQNETKTKQANKHKSRKVSLKSLGLCLKTALKDLCSLSVFLLIELLFLLIEPLFILANTRRVILVFPAKSLIYVYL